MILSLYLAIKKRMKNEPNSYDDVVKGKDSKKQLAIMEEEMASLIKNKSW